MVPIPTKQNLKSIKTDCMPGLNGTMKTAMTVLPYNKSEMTSVNNQLIFPQTSVDGTAQNAREAKEFRGLVTLKHKNSDNSANKGVMRVLSPVLKTTTSALQVTINQTTPRNLPPPRPLTLTIPIPKCQSAQQHCDTRIQLTPAEIDKCCQ